MKDFILKALLLVAFGEIVVLLLMDKKPQEKVLAVQTTATPTSSPTALPIPTATPIETPLALPKPTAKAETSKSTRTPAPRPQFTYQQINGFIDRFAAQYGVDPNVLRYIAICESGFNPGAFKAGYAGLYQFGAVTWKNLRAKIGEDTNVELRFNAEEAVQTAAYAVSQGKSGLWPNCFP